MNGCEKCGNPTHRDNAMNRRCDSCEHLTRQCDCPPELKVGDRIHVEYWVGAPKWLTKNDGTVTELKERTFIMRDDRKTMGSVAHTIVSRDAVDSITWK